MQPARVIIAAMLDIAVVGAGRIGRIHAGNITAHPGARLIGIADVLPDAAAALATILDVKPLTIDAAMRADAVLIATPTPTHADYIEHAAAGKNGRCCARSRSTSTRRAPAPVSPPPAPPESY